MFPTLYSVYLCLLAHCQAQTGHPSPIDCITFHGYNPLNLLPSRRSLLTIVLTAGKETAH